MTTTPLPTVGFVGLGHMGGAMAARLLDLGYPVCGTSRTRARVAALEAQGLRWFQTPRALAAAADFVMTSLPDDRTITSVAGGQNGIIAGLSSGEVWADLSTISPSVSRELATRVAATGASMVDAPVSGSVPQVHAGALTIMVGGTEAAYDSVAPVLRALGIPSHVGPNGHGLALKLGINISLAVQVLAFAEGLLLAERLGVDRQVAMEVMLQSPIGSPMLKARGPLLLQLPEEAWFDIALMQKDLHLALEAGRIVDTTLPTAVTADEMLTVARARGYERRDIAAMYEVLRGLTAPSAGVS